MTAHKSLSLGRRLLLLGLLSLGLASGSAWAGTDGRGSGAKPTLSTKDYDVYITGSTNDSQPPLPSSPMLVLMGGASDIDAAFRAMIAKGRGASTQGVDAVIVRTSGADDYNAYLTGLVPGGVNSVSSIVIKTRAGAAAQAVVDLVGKAELIFIAGGDQSTYVALWAGTPLEAAMKDAVALRNVPLGGNSAGLAVLGQFDYAALSKSVTSSEAMTDPYNRNVTLDRSLLNSLPWMTNVITDTHLVARDRMGRLVTFMARIEKDHWVIGDTDVRGIGVDEHTAVVIDNGIGTVMGNPLVAGSGRAYFLRPTIAPTTVKAKTPLTYRSVQVEKRTDGQSYDLTTWSPVSPYSLSVESGVLTSSQNGGSVY